MIHGGNPPHNLASSTQHWGRAWLYVNKNNFNMFGLRVPCPSARANVAVFPARSRLFLTHNMARPPKDFFATDFRVSPRKICGKICRATLSGRAIFLSIEARFKVRGRFLPHIMAADTWRPHQGKKGQKGHATLCGRTFGALVLYLQRLWRDSRHIIWRESAMI
jgi:hypothetical protein